MKCVQRRGFLGRDRRLLLGALLLAAGCEGGATAPGATQGAHSGSPKVGASNPQRDPMSIGQPTPEAPKTVPPGIDRVLFPAPGATEFETAKQIDETASPNGSAPGGTTSLPTAATSSGAKGDAIGGANFANPTTGAVPTQANNPGVMREIVEADIVQAQGDTLYVLNRYRGLLLVDMSSPDSPYVLGRVPFQAQPVDMYLRDGRAYIVMSDYFTYWQFDKGADPLGFHGSQVMVVDVNDGSHPAVIGNFNVDGEVTDTRIVGDVLYAVSKRNPDYWRYDTQDWHDTTWVLSIDISDPTQIHQVDKKEFPGAANLIQVYQTALSIAAVDPNYYLVDDQNVQQTLVTYVDISDPKGAIEVGGTAYVPGTVQDKFKMDLDAGQLRIISQNWYWQPDAAAVLSVFDVSDPSKLVMSAQIDIAGDVPAQNTYVQARATRFLGPDLFVNLCWYDSSANTQRCRLDLYDLSSAASPQKVAQLDVDGAITHFEARGNRLLALGDHYYYARPSQVQIALYDITNLRTTHRISAVDLGGQGSSSAALSDYKAFKVLDELGMILLPLTWYEMPASNQFKSYVGAQIVDWKNDQLVARGRLAQRGYVERAIAFHDRVVSISTQEIQVIDASNRDKPVQTASLFLVRNVVDVFNIHDYQVQLGADEEDSTFRFFVLPFGEDDMKKSVAELPVDAGLFYQMQAGDVIHLVGNDPKTGDQLIRNADFSDPLHPRWRGEYRIPAEIQHIYNGGYYGYWSFYDYYWNPAAGQPLNAELLPVTTRIVKTASDGRRHYKNFLRVIDLRDIDNPHLSQASIEMPDSPFVNRVTHGDTLFSVHTEPAPDAKGNPKKYHERYFVDRVDASDPDQLKALPKVNVPGRLIDVDASGTILYTVDYQFDEFGRRRNSFDVLKLEGDKATLMAVLPVGDEIDRARYLDREVWLSTHRYPWWGRSDDSPDSRQPYTRLTRLRFSDQAELTSKDSHDVAGYHFDLLDVEGTRVYLASSYPTGLLVLDTADLANPTTVGASRTIGYVSKIVRADGYLYMPMGSYGVRRAQVN